MKRTVRVGQVLRDLARDMIDRDRRLRVLALGDDGRAECLVVHDYGGTTGRKPFIQIAALASPSKFELVEEADEVTADPRYTVLLAAITAVHGPDASPGDYARAAFHALASPDVAAP
jgi:Family of unknown function (DUF6354)